MEGLNNNLEQNDPWRKAILAERKQIYFSKQLQIILDAYNGERQNALILGDACLVNSHLFLEQEKFAHVINVDSSPSLMDDDIVSITDTRLERVLKHFDEYTAEPNSLNFIYGKSIAFNPKDTTQKLLKDLEAALVEGGVFYAEWAGKGDNFRRIWYTREELEQMYALAGFKIETIDEYEKEVRGLINPGHLHAIDILASKT